VTAIETTYEDLLTEGEREYLEAKEQKANE
jgi:hypothetical protein